MGVLVRTGGRLASAAAVLATALLVLAKIGVAAGGAGGLAGLLPRIRCPIRVIHGRADNLVRSPTPSTCARQ